MFEPAQFFAALDVIVTVEGPRALAVDVQQQIDAVQAHRRNEDRGDRNQQQGVAIARPGIGQGVQRHRIRSGA